MPKGSLLLRLSISCLIAGCADDADEPSGDAPQDTATPLDSTAAWLPWPSDSPSRSTLCHDLDTGLGEHGAVAASCDGDPCDSWRLACAPIPTGLAPSADAAGSYWTLFLGGNAIHKSISCNHDPLADWGAPFSAITGLVDGIRISEDGLLSLRCRSFVTPPEFSDCDWTDWLGVKPNAAKAGRGPRTQSDRLPGPSYFFVAAECAGSVCESARFMYCRISAAKPAP